MRPDHRGRLLLTGANGGIGRAIAERLAREGWRLLLVGRSPEALQNLQQSLPGGAQAHAWLQADITSADDRAQLCREARQLGDTSGLINCAGTSRFALIDQLDDAALRQLFDTNVLAPMALCRDLLPLLQLRHGVIINIGSTFGSIGYPGFSAYCASKFALRGFTEALRRELADSPVTVHYVAPRAVDTPLNSPAVQQLNRELGNSVDAPEVVAAAVSAALASKRGGDRYLGWPEKLFVRINGLLPRLVDNALRKPLARVRHHASTERL
jgi:short-subunit dehydrogenase